jgi:hypothetical protein
VITSDDLAMLSVRRLIFHDVPRKERGGPQGPTLTNGETQLDLSRAGILKDRLVRAVGGASPVEFSEGTSSPIATGVRFLTEVQRSVDEFVESSRTMANYLFEQQIGQISAGLLCVAQVVSNGIPGVAIMKLEREKGAKLDLVVDGDRQTFAMAVLNDLVLTDGTKLFKAALFLRDGDSFRSVACDNQNAPVHHLSIADFWLRFLGCKFTLSPTLATRDWFDVTVKFVNDFVTDPVVKNTLYESLASELKSNRHTVSPKKFMEDYVQRDLRRPYTEALEKGGVSLSRFQKDVSEIASKLARKAYYTVNGVSVVAPADQEALIQVGKKQIVVNDELKNIVAK